MPALFPIAYLPPVSYFLDCASSDHIIIEQHEHFVKQTLRNRCEIYGPNGKQLLVIPVVHENLFRIPISEVRISYSERWNKIHWRSVCAAYRNSPYFEYYEGDFSALFDSPGEYLFDFNMSLLKLLLKLFSIRTPITYTSTFDKAYNIEKDLRNEFQKTRSKSSDLKYRQVFSEKYGFIADLSAIDFLFNAGVNLPAVY